MENSENLVNVPLNQVLDAGNDGTINTTRYEKISQDTIIRLKNDNLNITYSRTFGEHLLSFLFFIARVLFLFALPIILFGILGLNITNSFNNAKNIINNKPIFSQTNLINDYLTSTDKLLKN